MADTANHTPAPWAAVRSNPAEGADVWWIVGNLGAHNAEKDIGSVQGGCSPTHEADAALIAAAPDLLAALQAFPGFTDDASVGDPWIEQMRSAIAKATAA